jgi:mono/diheme cytochrome c family protein
MRTTGRAASQNRRMRMWIRSSLPARAVAAIVLVLLITASHSDEALAQTAVPSRGELLYTTHCIACHTSQMHWRDRRVATDFPGVLGQVMTWQARAQLNWTPEDIVEVARFVNDRYYRYPRSEPRAAVDSPQRLAVSRPRAP